jgi:hypothetical protein
VPLAGMDRAAMIKSVEIQPIRHAGVHQNLPTMPRRMPRQNMG